MTRTIILATIVSFAAPALGHEIDCEKGVGVLATDAQGNTDVDANGAPVFSRAPAPILALDVYPVTVGWQLRVNNLAQAPSTIQDIQDAFLATSSATTPIALPPVPFELPIGGSATSIVARRIGSYEDCIALDGSPATALASVSEVPACGGARENRLVVTTETNLAECRARLVCRRPAPPTCVAPEWTGMLRPAEGANGAGLRPSSAAFGVAVGCDGVTHIAGSTLEYARDILARFDRTGALASAKLFSPNDYINNALHTVKLEASGRRIYGGGFLHRFGPNLTFEVGSFGVLGVMLPDDTIAWQKIFFDVLPQPRLVTADVDAVGNIYAAFATNVAGTPSAVVQKVTAAGDLVWARSLALVVGPLTSVGRIAVTPSGDVFVPVHGSTSSLVRLDTDGNVVWATEVFAGVLGTVQAVAVDALGNSAVAGTMQDAVGASPDAAVAALDPAGNVRWLRTLPVAVPGGVAIEPSGAVWVAGRTWGQLPGATSLGGTDGFVARYGPDGTLLWTRQVGGPFEDELADIALDAAGYGVAAGSQGRDDTYVDRDVLLVRIAPDGTF